MNLNMQSLPHLLPDIRAQLQNLGEVESLTPDGQGIVMMIQRLLLMLEAESTLTSSCGEVPPLPPELTSLIGSETSPHSALPTLISHSVAKAAGNQQLLAATCHYLLGEAQQFGKARQNLAASDPRIQRRDTAAVADRFESYLRGISDNHDLCVTEFKQIPGGYSKTSIAVTLQGDKLWNGRILVRMDVKDGPTSFTVADEYPLLQSLYDANLAVAKPWHLETDPEILGQPFMLSAFCCGQSSRSGDPTVAAWGADSERRRHLGLQMATALGKLHSHPIETKKNASTVLADYLQEWQRRWQDLKAESQPGITLAFDWLQRNIPSDIPRTCWIHGDFAPYNALQSDGNITAIIDWEFAHIGDPAEDVGYCRSYMESLLPWQTFLQAYYDAGGPEYRPDCARFYEVWADVRNAIVLLQGWQAYAEGRNRDIRTVYAPAEYFEYFLSSAIRKIKEAIEV